MTTWKKTWEKVGDCENGGQSKTYLVKQKGYPHSPIYVLKELNKQKDVNRRKRMYREYAILKTLELSSIPSVIYSNAEMFNELNEKLYIVMEHIPGISLEKAIQDKLVTDFDDFLCILFQLLNALDFCHDNDIIHRDIKPDNIILREKSPQDVVLLDFGQSFNAENTSELITPDSEIMGNRFLSLPELSIYSGTKNDKRSDITMAFGIFFYCLTGILPRILIDQDGKLPHQRHTVKTEYINYPSHARIIRMFDIAFQPQINNRYQSIKTAMEDLRALRESLTSPINTAERSIDQFLSARTSQSFDSARELIKIIDTCHDIIHKSQNGVLKSLGNDFSISQGKSIKDYKKLVGGKTYRIHDKIKQTSSSFMVCVVVTGDELVFISKQIEEALSDTVDYTRGEQIYRCGLNSFNENEILVTLESDMLSKYINIP